MSTNLKRITTHALIYTIAPQVGRVSGLLALPLITKYLTTTDYAIYGIILAYSGILDGLSGGGLLFFLSNSFIKYPNKYKLIWRQIHLYMTSINIVLACLQAVLIYFLIPIEAEPNKWYIISILCIQTGFLSVTTSFGVSYFQINQIPKYVGIVTSIVGISSVLLQIICIAYLKLGYMGFFWANFGSSFLLFCFYGYPLYFKYNLKPMWVFRKKFILPKLKLSFPMVLHAYSSYLTNSSTRVILDRAHISKYNIGQFNIAFNLVANLESVLSGITNTLVPIYLRLFKTGIAGQLKIRNITLLLQVCLLVATFVMSLWVKEAFFIVIKNPGLRSSYPFAVFFIMAFNYRPLYWSLGTLYFFHEKTKSIATITFTSGVVILLLNVVLVPFFGIWAAVYISFFMSFSSGYFWFFLKSYKELSLVKYYPIHSFTINIFFSILVYFLADLPIVYKLCITFVLAMLLLSIVLKFKDKIKSTFSL